MLLVSLKCSIAFTQEKLLDSVPMKEGKVIYEGVVVTDSVSQSELRRRAKKWFIDAYKSSKDVISMDEADEIIGKGILKTKYQANFMYIYDADLWHTVDLQFKDGKYRYIINDFRTKYTIPRYQNIAAQDVEFPLEDWGKGGRKENSKKYLIQVDEHVRALIKSIETALKSPSNTKKDW